jgi:hypothetical protein
MSFLLVPFHRGNVPHARPRVAVVRTALSAGILRHASYSMVRKGATVRSATARPAIGHGASSVSSDEDSACGRIIPRTMPDRSTTPDLVELVQRGIDAPNARDQARAVAERLAEERA